MTQPMPKGAIPLAILDPALGRTGAHNLGFAEMMLARPPGPLGFWCADAMTGAQRVRLEGEGATVAPVFRRDFYALFHQSGGVAEHWDWIHGFCNDYLRALRQVLERWPDGPVRVLHHTLSWEHATALSLAIGLLGAPGSRLRHLVLLMYSPGLSADGTVLDAARRLNFRLAFAALDRIPGVALHASCSEHALAYAALLDRGAPLPVHPCFLGDWREAPSAAAREPGRVLAYAGEAKQEKGFLELPERLARMARDDPAPDARFVVHCVEARTDAARETLGAVHSLAAGDPRILVHVGHWNDERLHQEFARAGVVCLDYDREAYAHKTSGLLWLAAWHRLPVRVPEGSWLAREGKRMGLALLPSNGPADARRARIDRNAENAAYRQAIFRPFDEWLVEQGEAARIGAEAVPAVAPAVQPEALAGIRVAVADAAARRPRSAAPTGKAGADVVLFWKQNDSTLYGRRNDMVARYLAGRDDVRRVVVVDAPMGEAELARLSGSRDGVRQDRWIHSRTIEKLRGTYDTEKLLHRIFIYSADEFEGNQNDGPDPRFLDRYAEFLEGMFAAEHVHPAQSVFWVYPRNLAMPRLLERFSPARVVVDVVDDHRAWPGVSDEEKRCLTGNYRSLLASADIALANCASVQQAMRGFCPGIRLVPNGCDGDPPQARPDAGSGFDAFLAHTGRTIGYVGNLEAKIDIELLSHVAERFPDCQLVLVGSTHANPRVLELLRHPNVRLPGVVPYDQLGNWLSKFDVGLIPHLEMDLTRYMNPLKAYVYLSWGVPVVATAVPNVEPAAGLVRTAASHEHFLDQIARVLDGERSPRQAFRDYARANDWKSRLSGVVEALDLPGLAGSDGESRRRPAAGLPGSTA